MVLPAGAEERSQLLSPSSLLPEPWTSDRTVFHGHSAAVVHAQLRLRERRLRGRHLGSRSDHHSHLKTSCLRRSTSGSHYSLLSHISHRSQRAKLISVNSRRNAQHPV